MAKKMVGFHDAETGEFTEREMNAEELEQLSKDVETGKARKAELDKQAAAKEAVLAKLGLTADEVAALLG